MIGFGPDGIRVIAGVVLRTKADLGFAFDGDGGRLVAVGHFGCTLDGDKIAYVFASYLKEQDRLMKNTIVGNEFTSLGIEKAIHKKQINLLRMPIDEKETACLMQKEGYMLSFERNGGIVLKEFLHSSDALLNALLLCKIVKQSKKACMTWFWMFLTCQMCKNVIILKGQNWTY